LPAYISTSVYRRLLADPRYPRSIIGIDDTMALLSENNIATCKNRGGNKRRFP
jgi:hypothetical protein